MNAAQPVFDKMLVGTPFRALVIHGFAGYCAYIGVPQDHCLADMNSLQFDCHGEITFRGPGDGDLRPEGWYWYGWDYQQPGDKAAFPVGIFDDLPPDLASMLAREQGTGKEWTVAEIEQDLMDSAMGLWDVLNGASQVARAVVQAAQYK